MKKLKQFLLGSAAILLPGGLLLAAALLAYNRIMSNRDAIQKQVGNGNSIKN